MILLQFSLRFYVSGSFFYEGGVSRVTSESPVRPLSGPWPVLSVKVDAVQDEESLQLHFGS